MPPTPTAPASRSLQSKPRRVHLVLRDGTEVEGGIFLNDGQALAPYLGTRKGGWVNLVDARWLSPVEEVASHAVLQSDQVLYAYGVEGDVPVHSVQASLVSPRAIEVTLTNGTRVSGDLAIANRQRLSDFLHTSGKFIPIVAARRSDTGAAVGSIALNHAAVRALRDTGSGSRAAIESEFAAEGTPHAGTPVVRGLTPPRQASLRASLDAPIIEGPSAIAEEISRSASRPSLRLNLDDDSRPVIEEVPTAPAVAPYSAAVTEVAERAASHWLSRVAERFGLVAADPRRLAAAFTDEALWAGIARANDLSVDEFARHVATAFRLPVARLDAAAPDARTLLDESVARQHRVCPVRGDETTLVVATADPTDTAAVAALRERTGRAITLEVAPPTAVQGALDWWYRTTV